MSGGGGAFVTMVQAKKLVDSSPLASTVNIESRSVQVTFPEKQGGAY